MKNTQRNVSFESIHKAVKSSSNNHRLILKVRDLGEHLPTAAGNILALLDNLEMTAMVRSLNLEESDSVSFCM